MNKILVALFTLLVLHAPAHAADKIRIGFGDLAAPFLSLPLGEKRGFFREEGLQAEFIRVNPTVALAALVSGELDYYTIIPPAVTAAIRGVPVKVVACYVPRTPVALIARGEFKSVHELRNKAIGLNTFGGALETIARLMFKHFRLDPDKEIKFVATGPIENRFAVMSQGLTAATLSAPPSDFLGRKMGFVVLARADELFSYPVNSLLASMRKIRERSAEVKRVIKAGIKADRYIHQNRDGTIQVIAEWLKVEKEMAVATHDSVSTAFNDDGSVSEDGLRLVIEEVKRAIKVDRQVSVSEVADLSILKDAQRELGITAR